MIVIGTLVKLHMKQEGYLYMGKNYTALWFLW